MSRIRILIALFLTCVLSAVTPAEEVEFPRDLPEGTVYTTMHTQATYSTSGHFEDEPFHNKSNHETTEVYKVTIGPADENGFQKVEIRFVLIVARMHAGEKTYIFDSRNSKTVNTWPTRYKEAVMSTPITAIINTNRKVTEVHGLDAMIEILQTDENSNDNDHTEKLIRTSFSPEQIEKMIYPAADMLPEESVEAGETWRKASIAAPYSGLAQIMGQLQLKSVEIQDDDRVATITYSAEATGNNDPAIKSKGVFEEFNPQAATSQEFTAEYLINLKTGLIDHAKAETCHVSTYDSKEDETLKYDESAFEYVLNTAMQGEISFHQSRERDEEAEEALARKILGQDEDGADRADTPEQEQSNPDDE